MEENTIIKIIGYALAIVFVYDFKRALRVVKKEMEEGRMYVFPFKLLAMYFFGIIAAILFLLYDLYSLVTTTW